MYTAFIIYLIIVGIIMGVILSKKFREVLAVVLVAAVLFAFVLTLHGAARAEDVDVVEGIITRVAPGFFDGYPVIIVTVETFDGEIYTYYSEDEIDVQGIVVLTLFGEEVLNVE